jgi:hypothetical protein
MIAQNYYYEDIPLSLKELINVYNSACPSLSKYEDYSQIPYILNSSVLMEILLKRILFKVNGRYRGVHSSKLLKDSFAQFGVKLRRFTDEEEYFLAIDHSNVRYHFDEYLDVKLNEYVVDGLFKYFINLAIEYGVE